MQTLDATAAFKVNVVTRQIPERDLPTHQRVYHQHQPTTAVNGSKKNRKIFTLRAQRKESWTEQGAIKKLGRRLWRELTTSMAETIRRTAVQPCDHISKPHNGVTDTTMKPTDNITEAGEVAKGPATKGPAEIGDQTQEGGDKRTAHMRPGVKANM